MKWIKQDKAKDDGRYLAYLDKDESMTFVYFKDRMWYTQTSQGLIGLPGIKFDAVCKLVRPKK